MSSISSSNSLTAGDRIAGAAADRPPRAPDRRRERIVGIGVLAHEIELDLRRHHGLQPVLLIGLEHALEQIARGELDRAPVLVDEVADHLGGRIVLPRHRRQRREVRHQLQVAVVLGIDEAVAVLGVAAGNRRHEHGRRQGEGGVGDELLRRHHLAAGDAGLVRRDAFDVLDAAPFEPGPDLLPVSDAAQVLDELRRARAAPAACWSGFLSCGCHRSPDFSWTAHYSRGARGKGRAVSPARD